MNREELGPSELVRVGQDDARDALEAPPLGGGVEGLRRGGAVLERDVDGPPERFPVERRERVVRAVGVGVRVDEGPRQVLHGEEEDVLAAIPPRRLEEVAELAVAPARWHKF